MGWAVLHEGRQTTGRHLGEFIDALSPHLVARRPVALGFECPLYVPKREDVQLMTGCRLGEEGVNWCGGPGASVLTTGIVQVNWVLAQLARRMPGSKGTTRWAEFSCGQCQLFIWEAFITSRAGVEVAVDMKDGVSLHEGDALCGALAFRNVLVKEDQFPSDLQHEPALSLIGMHLLETGWSDDRSLMSESCSVLKVRKPTFSKSSWTGDLTSDFSAEIAEGKVRVRRRGTAR